MDITGAADDGTVIEVTEGWIVGVINECSTATRRAAGELELPITVPRGGPEVAREMPEARIVEVADAWFEVFGLAPDSVAMAARLNELLAPAPPRVRVATAGDAVRVETIYRSSAEPAHRLASAGARRLADTIAELGPHRVGICSARRCVDVYIDRSPRRNRRFCSQLCQTRERVRRHRERRTS